MVGSDVRDDVLIPVLFYDFLVHYRRYTSESEFPDHNYPPYCQGTTYLLSAKTIRKLLQFQRQDPNPIFVWEDIYFTGNYNSLFYPHYRA